MTVMQTNHAPPDAEATMIGGRLDYLPVGFFGSVMGLTGLSVAWRLAHLRFDAPEWIAQILGVAAVVAFIALSVGYFIKFVTSPKAVKAEFHHPIVANLFGTILISLLLLPIVIEPVALQLAQAMWIVGALGMALFACMMVRRWINERQQLAHATPAWIVPVVGLLDVPLALPKLGLPPMHGVMVASLAIGLFFAIPLFTLIFSRLVFEERMPAALEPTLLILVAPFAVGTSTYAVVVGQIDLFAEGLYALTLFMLTVLLGRLRFMSAACPFRVSWWAVSFPLAASAIAGLRVAEARPSLTTDAIALGLLALASAVIIGLLVRTVIGLARGELRLLST